MGVERVRDADDPRLADYRELRDGERRRRAGTFVAESRQVVRRLLGSRFRARSVLATEAAAADLRDLLADGLPVYVAPEETLGRVVGFNFHRGCLAVGERGADLPLDALLDGRLLVVLEGSRTPTTWAASSGTPWRSLPAACSWRPAAPTPSTARRSASRWAGRWSCRSRARRRGPARSCGSGSTGSRSSRSRPTATSTSPTSAPAGPSRSGSPCCSAPRARV